MNSTVSIYTTKTDIPILCTREFPRANEEVSPILIVFRTEMRKILAIHESSHAEQLRLQVEEVKQFYASLISLRSRCIEVDEHSPLSGSRAKEENPTSDDGCQMRVLLRHDQYQALKEIVTELTFAVNRHHRDFSRNGSRYTPRFQRTYTARKCNSITTWTDEGMETYHWLLSIRDSDIVDLESLLLGAEALLRLFCETVANFKVLWLKCLNGLSAFYSVPKTEIQSESLFLHVWNNTLGCSNSYLELLFSGRMNLYLEGEDHLVTRLKCTMRLLISRFASSLISEHGRQPHNHLTGRVKAVRQDLSRMISTRKELPMIIGGKEINAQHDSGAERGNFMDCDLASKLNLRLRTEKGDCKRFCMGNGKIVKALGRVRAVCAFVKEAQTKMKCWFYVFNELASPLIMGSQFLEKTKTLSDHVHRLENCILKPGIVPMVNLIGSTQHAKRRFTAHIDHRLTLINADSGSDLDLMSSAYVRAHGYRLDRRRRCRKRVRFADNTMAETIGQVQATLTLEDGSMYTKTFDVLPELTSDVLLGQFTLEEIEAFQNHKSSFVDVCAGERYLELSVLGYLGKVNEFLACKLRRVHRRRRLRQKHGKLFQYHLKRLRFATNPWISIACETAGRRFDGSSAGSRPGSREASPPE